MDYLDEITPTKLEQQYHDVSLFWYTNCVWDIERGARRACDVAKTDAILLEVMDWYVHEIYLESL